MSESAHSHTRASGGLAGRALSTARKAWAAIDRADALLLLSLLVVVGCVFLFHEMGESITGQRIPQLDERIIRSLRVAGRPGEPLGPFWLRSTMRDLTALGSPALLVLVVFGIAGALLIRRQHHGVVLLLSATLGGRFLNVFLKEVFSRPRPDLALRLTEVASASFPSGHAMDSATIYLTTAAILARLVEPLALKVYVLVLAILLSFVAGVTRVYLGVHYPSDVLAGWTAGLGWALFCWTVARWLQRRGSVEKSK
jgi:undecaprenyl-diphosphatase